MLSRVLVPSLALAIAIPAAHAAVDVADEGVNMKFGFRMQNRVELSDVSAASGESATLDNADIMARRLRFGVAGTYNTAFRYKLTMRADKLGQQSTLDNAELEVHEAWTSYQFRNGNQDHTVRIGVEKPGYNGSYKGSSSSLLFPTRMPGARWDGVKGMGLAYRVEDRKDIWRASLEVVDANGQEDMYYGLRLESSFDRRYAMKKRRESFLGKRGVEHLVGIGYGTIVRQGPDNNQIGIVLDGAHHIDEYSASWEIHQYTEEGAGDDREQLIVSAQVGWYMERIGETIVEPAVRVSMIDLDDDGMADTYSLSSENGGSGTQFDLGVNFYFDGHNNKLQLAYTNWTADEGNADANVIRLQHQLNF